MFATVRIFGLAILIWIAAAMPISVPAQSQAGEAEQLRRRIEALKAAGKHQQAIAAAERRVKLLQQRSRGNSAETASALQEWSDLLADQYRHADALPIVRQALAIREKISGPNHPDTAYTLNQMAWSLEEEGADADAEPHLRRALTVREKALGVNNAQTAISVHRLGRNLGRQGKLVDAEVVLRRAVDMRAHVLGKEHPDTAASLELLAHVLHSLGRQGEAEATYRRVLVIQDKTFGEENPQSALTLNNLGFTLEQQDKYEEAVVQYRRSIAIREKVLGPEHPDTAFTLLNLGNVLEKAKQYDHAIAAYQRALAIREKVLGPEHVSTALTLHNLAYTYTQQSKNAEAVRLFQRAIAIYEKQLGEHTSTALTWHLISQAYFSIGNFDAAIDAADRALAIRQKVLPADHLDIATSLMVRALYHQVRGQFPQAEELGHRAHAIQLKHMAPDDPRLAETMELLGYLNEFQARHAMALKFFSQGLEIRERRFGREDVIALRLMEGVARMQEFLGRYDVAEASYRSAISIREKMFGPDDAAIAPALIGLADGYDRQGRVQESLPLYQRGLLLRERTFGPDNFLVAVSLIRIGRQLQQLKRLPEAEAALRRALSINEKTHGPSHFFTSINISDLAVVLDNQGQTAEAERLFKRCIEIQEASLGPNHPTLATSVGWLAFVYWKLGRAEEAEALRARQLAINRNAYGPDNDTTASSYASLAWVQLERNKWAEALANYTFASQIYIGRNLKSPSSLRGVSQRSNEGEIGRNSWTFLNHIRAGYWARTSDPSSDRQAAFTEESFELAQWAQLSDTGAALAQMSARTGSGNGALASLVREHQDLAGEWRSIDTQRSQFLAEGASANTKLSAKTVKARLDEIDIRLADITRELQEKFPDYAALSNPRALSAKELQSLLGADEALLQFSITPLDCFVWVVTREGIRWVRLDIEERQVITAIATLRQQATSRGRFDLDLAHSLYKGLFGALETYVHGKHLLIVPSGALATLPLHLLVTEKPNSDAAEGFERYRNVAWMVKRQPITILPSVSALKALRQQARRSAASKPFLGLGNPLLVGPAGDDRSAWEAKGCPPAEALRVATREQSRPVIGGTAVREVSSFFRGGVANIAEVRRLEPLPETVAELCAVATSLGSDEHAVVLGAAATETTVKRLSLEGTLASARVVHFATHGLIAGDIEGLAEPALVLTPPPDGTDDKSLSQDDGLLTASEIAQLKLDADWVVLSACNTASGRGQGAEALSGLARAFFYAGARALLVSHWEVDSKAAVKLTTGAFNAMTREPAIGRAEALRQAMLALIDSGEDYEAHPAFWAPFVVVGEGAAASQ